VTTERSHPPATGPARSPGTLPRLLSYLKPYAPRLALAVLTMALYAAASGLTLGLFSPLLQILFATRDGIVATATPGAAPAPVPAGPGTLAGPPSGPAGDAERALLSNAKWGSLERWPRVLRDPLEKLLFEGTPLEALGRMCLLLLLAFLLKNVFDYVSGILMIAVEQAVVRDLRNALVVHLHSLSLAFFHGERVGILASRIINDVQLVRGALAAGISNVIKESLVLAAALFWVVWVSWKLALVSLLILPPVVGIVVWIGHRMRRRSSAMQERMGDVQAVLHESLANIRVVKSFHAEAWEAGRFARENDRFYRSFLRLKRLGEAATPITEYAMIVVAAGVIWYGGQQIFRDRTLAPQDFMVFMVALLSMMSPLRRLAGVNSTLQEGLAAGDRIFRLLDTPADIADRSDARPVAGFTDAIRFEDVSFSYATGEPVLTGLSLTLARGETVALVGPSGAGKSTIADLLPRFYDPTGGRITLDGQDLRDLRLAELRPLFGIVPQETILFHDTVARNIAYGRDAVPQAEIEAAARAANAHDFIARLPQGYDTPIGERGVKLSGGERQRVAMARAVLKDPAILILDEATSALDSANEVQVQAAIESLRAGRTALIIAHRLSTVQRADRILVIERGRIVEEGRHAELLARAGLYAHLHGLQFQVQD
jgi:subfamily B ATP-binding cassette protein MsbA